jgi:hypothetical protein
MSNWIELITTLSPGAEVAVVGGNTYSDIVWGSTPVIAESVLLAQESGLALSKAKKQKLAQLEQLRKSTQTQNVTVQGKQFPANGEYRELIFNMASRSSRGKPIPAQLRGVNGQAVNLTPVLLGQIEDAIVAQIESAWANYWSKFDMVQAATTVEQVNSIQW